MEILQTSLSAAVLILIIVLIRALVINRLPKKTFLILWDIVLCRLLIPFSIPLRLRAYSEPGNVSRTFPKEDIIRIVPNTSIQYHTANTVPAEAIGASSTPSAAFSFVSNWSIFVLIWSTVAIIMASFFLVTHLRCLKKYKTALPVNGYVFNWCLSEHSIRRTIQIRQLDTIAVPLTYGIWRPVILLPKIINSIDEWRMKYILAHELIHIKRFDTLRKWLLAAALCIHWFNPLVWAMYVLANRDIELACDEAVVRAFGQTSRSSYALALIGMEEAKIGLAPLSSNFNKKAIEERVILIMKTKEVTIFSRVLAFMLVVVMTVIFAVSLIKAEAEPKTLGLFRKAFGDDVYKYADNINEVTGESAVVVTDDCTIRLESTIFTDHNVYAIMSVEGELPEDFRISGRIVDPIDTPRIPRWEYMLFGSMEEIGHEDGVRYFFCSATITDWLYIKPQDIDEEFIKAHTNPDSDCLKYDSLKDCEGKTLELTLNLNGSKYTLTTIVTNVFTENIVFRSKLGLYDGYCIEEIVLTPFELKIRGFTREIDEHPESTGGDDNGWIEPHVRATIVLVDGKEIDLDYDDRGGFFYQDHPIGVLRSYDTSTSKFYYNWRFNRWEIDLNQVAAVTVNGITYRVDGRKDL